MTTWVRVILAVLNIAQSLTSWVKSRYYIRVGEDKIIAQAALRVLAATDEGKRLRERVQELGDAEADKLWDDITNA